MTNQLFMIILLLTSLNALAIDDINDSTNDCRSNLIQLFPDRIEQVPVINSVEADKTITRPRESVVIDFKAAMANRPKRFNHAYSLIQRLKSSRPSPRNTLYFAKHSMNIDSTRVVVFGEVLAHNGDKVRVRFKDDKGREWTEWQALTDEFLYIPKVVADITNSKRYIGFLDTKKIEKLFWQGSNYMDYKMVHEREDYFVWDNYLDMEESRNLIDYLTKQNNTLVNQRGIFEVKTYQYIMANREQIADEIASYHQSLKNPGTGWKYKHYHQIPKADLDFYLSGLRNHDEGSINIFAFLLAKKLTDENIEETIRISKNIIVLARGIRVAQSLGIETIAAYKKVEGLIKKLSSRREAK